jgi:hypothetical protein
MGVVKIRGRRWMEIITWLNVGAGSGANQATGNIQMADASDKRMVICFSAQSIASGCVLKVPSAWFA